MCDIGWISWFIFLGGSKNVGDCGLGDILQCDHKLVWPEGPRIQNSGKYHAVTWNVILYIDC